MSKNLVLLALLFAFGWASVAHAGEREPKKNRNGSEQTSAKASAGVAACELGTATADLDVNNVRARLYNNGGLFWRGGDPVYEVPKDSGIQAIFASGIWIGGLDEDGELHFAGADYSDWEFWPGPLDLAGNAPADCTPFDRFWNVRRVGEETITVEGTDFTLPIYEGDVDSWPVDLGAPYFDVNQDGAYNYADGDRPAVVATSQGDVSSILEEVAFPDQQIWWVMNDKGNAHNWSNAQPLGLEVRAHAFAFATADAIGNTTFYKYQFVYRGEGPLNDVFLGLWSDPDLGDFNDDYVGSDPVLGLGYVYNGDNNDEGGYGTLPPALGYDFFQGPLVDNDGLDNDGDGEIDDEGERIAMEKFVYYNNDFTEFGNPEDGNDAYGYLTGIWKDETPITRFGNGYNPGSEFPVADYIWPADPPEFWSEYNTDGVGTANVPADRRFLMSAGPFTLEPTADGALEEGRNLQNIVFGIQWARNSSTATNQPQIASQRLLEFENALVQGAFNANFNIPRPPSPPQLTATGLDGRVVLSWTNPPTSNNFRETFSIVSPFAELGASDVTYDFEGYRILQYQFLGDQNPEEIAVLDVVNGIGPIIDAALDPLTGEVVTDIQVVGGDTGVENYFVVNGLTNAREYLFAVQAYAYNEASSPLRVFSSPIQLGVNLQRVIPKQSGTFQSNTADLDDTIPLAVEGTPTTTGGAEIRIVDPASLTRDPYRVEFFVSDEIPPIVDEETGEERPRADSLAFRIINVADADTVFDAIDNFEITGEYIEVDSGEPIFFDGLEIVLNPVRGDTFFAGENGESIVEVAYGGTPRCNEGDESRVCDLYGGRTVWHTPSLENDYYVSAEGGSGTIDRLQFRTVASPFDYEMRFTDDCAAGNCWGTYGPPFNRDGAVAATVPFELWQIQQNPDGSYSDVVRLIPLLVSDADELGGSFAYGAFEGSWAGAGFDGGADPDAEVSDVLYWMVPDRDNGYDLFAGDAAAAGAGNLITDTDDQEDLSPIDGEPCRFQGLYIDFCYRNDESGLSGSAAAFMAPIGRFVLADQAGDDTVPPPGTVIRLVTEKATTEANAFVFDTAPFATLVSETEQVDEALEQIQIVPNPYRGYSAYERGNTDKIARFTNLPDEATIRIFTLAGTLVRTLEKVPGTGTILNWDLNNEAGLPVASGMYVIHIEVPGVGERVLKFGLVQRRLQLDTF